MRWFGRNKAKQLRRANDVEGLLVHAESGHSNEGFDAVATAAAHDALRELAAKR